MAAYATSLPNLAAGGYSGNITITIASTEGGGDPVDYDVDLIVAVQNSSYSFTGGVPAATTTFGNNGARWEGITFSSGETRTVIYNWSKSVSAGSDYVVMVLNNGDGAFYTQWGSLPPSISGI